MQIGQYSLNRFGSEKNKKFLELMYTTQELLNPTRFFDIIPPGSIKRVDEENMTLEKFFREFKKPYHLRLQVGSPDSERIRYVANTDMIKVDRFAWVLCQFNEHNYKIIEKLFKEAFLKELVEQRSLLRR